MMVRLPKLMSVNSTSNLVLETVQTHVTRPWPEKAAQDEDQKLKYDMTLFVLSPYRTVTQRTKIR
jgi:oligosaccharyltransferase complex subunit alpha (ribophorin I)